MGAIPLALIGSLGTGEILVILLVVLLFFGAKRLPELARGLGKSMREFKKATQDVQDDFQQALDAADPHKPDPARPRPAPRPLSSTEQSTSTPPTTQA